PLRDAHALSLPDALPISPPTALPDTTHGIHSTVRREAWVYEILEPVRRDETWHAEIRRAPREAWRPGEAGPFYVVEGASPEKALDRKSTRLNSSHQITSY